MTTTTTEPVDILVRMDMDTVAPRFMRALASIDAATTKQLDEAGIETALRELVRIRASQLPRYPALTAALTGVARRETRAGVPTVSRRLATRPNVDVVTRRNAAHQGPRKPSA